MNAWGIPYAAALTGARLVLPGTLLQGAQLAELMECEGVTIALGVPTVWVGLVRYLRSSGRRLTTMKRAIIGGATAPPSLIEALQQEFGIEVRHAWGMTELSPLGTIGTLKAKHRDLPPVERLALQAKQGRPVYGVQIKVVDVDGRALPHDGRSIGEIHVRGLWVLSGYYRSEQSQVDDGAGWFATGDVGTVDGDGYLQITDRKKDLMKCAGEWISSVEIETIAMQHDDVLQAAAIGVPDEKWGERPMLILCLRPGSSASREDILNLYSGRVGKWAVPNRIVFADSLPVCATVKVQKSKLREIARSVELTDKVTDWVGFFSPVFFVNNEELVIVNYAPVSVRRTSGGALTTPAPLTWSECRRAGRWGSRQTSLPLLATPIGWPTTRRGTSTVIPTLEAASAPAGQCASTVELRGMTM